MKLIMKTVLWIVVGLIVIALIVLLVPNGNKDDQGAVDTPTEMETTVDRASVRANAAADLAVLEARANAGETYAELADEYAMIRARVAAAYEDAEGEAAQEWEKIEAAFDSFEASAQAGTSAFLAGFADLMARLSADVRADTETE